ICLAITQQPATQTTVVGLPVTFHVTASGTGLSYQWYNGASGDTANPVGTGSSSLTMTPANSASFQFWVRVSNSCGSTDSSAAWMSVAPVIQFQPQNQTYLASGSRATLTVTAQGTSMHYQWCDASTSIPVSGAPDSPTFITPDITG